MKNFKKYTEEPLAHPHIPEILPLKSPKPEKTCKNVLLFAYKYVILHPETYIYSLHES